MDLHPGQAEVRPRVRAVTGGPLHVTEPVPLGPPCLLQLLLWSGLPGQDRWESSFSLVSCRELYAQFLREMIIQPGIAKANMGVSREDVTFEDHVSRGWQQRPRIQNVEGWRPWSRQGPLHARG